MRCGEFEARLQEVLDRRGDPRADEVLSAHAAECAACRALEHALSRALVRLASLRPPACRDNLATRILAEVYATEEGAAPSSVAVVELPIRSDVGAPRDRSAMWWAAVAAAVVLAAYPLWRWASPAGDSQVTAKNDAPPQAIQTVIGPQVVDRVVPPEPSRDQPLPTFSELAEESKDSYRKLAVETKRSLDDTLALASLWSDHSPVSVVAADSQSNWLSEVADGVAPLAETTLGAVNALRGVMPVEGDSKL